MCDMISPKEIETKEFNRAKNGGYRPDEVDSFLDEVLDSYRGLIEENAQLKEQVSLLNDRLDSVRDEQSQWKKTIINTQKSYNEVIQSANQKADKIVYDAQDYAKKLIASAQVEADNQKRIKDKVSSEVEDFKSKILSIYQSHIKLITSLPTIEMEDIEHSPTLDVLKASTTDVEEKENVSFDTIEKENDFVSVLDEKDTKEEVNDDGFLFDIENTPVSEETRVISNKDIQSAVRVSRAERFSEKQDQVDDLVSKAEEKVSTSEDKVEKLFNNTSSGEKNGFFGKKKKNGFFSRKKEDPDDDFDDDDDDDDE